MWDLRWSDDTWSQTRSSDDMARRGNGEARDCRNCSFCKGEDCGGKGKLNPRTRDGSPGLSGQSHALTGYTR
ncbi:hypothetical protein QQP08_001532 [Theobroma cacao]|nr:hypothetical protein QQP08_001532 [Theobroma cacao]